MKKLYTNVLKIEIERSMYDFETEIIKIPFLRAVFWAIFCRKIMIEYHAQIIPNGNKKAKRYVKS
jgi:hypothetical protein